MFETWIVNSFSTMPPASPMRGLVWRRAIWTPCTTTRLSVGNTRNTSPVLPLSRPLMTTTLSPFLIFSLAIGSQYFWRQRDDLHEPLGAQFAGNRPEDASPDRLAGPLDQHGRIAVKAEGAALASAGFPRR